MFQLLQQRNTGEYVPIRQVVLNALDKIEKASKSKGTVTGIPTGFIDLDYKLSGLQPSDLILVAARPSMGKTAFVLNIAQYVAFKKDRATAHFQSGDVEGAAGESIVLAGVTSRCAGASYR